jgi:Uma2 family endonuclease
MARPAQKRFASYAEYLDVEFTSDEKHDYLDGDIVPTAMSGGSILHGGLASSFGRLLGNALDGHPCRVFSSDVRIRVEETNRAFYPDLSVVCGALETANDDDQAIVNPVLLVEVLSDSTEGYDRGEKAAHYRRIPSLREYVLVSQREPHVEVYRKNEAGRWELWEHRAGETIALASVDAEIELDAIYADPLAQTTAT